jgi:hypothetical protein
MFDTVQEIIDQLKLGEDSLWAAPPPFADNTDQIKKQESAT